MQFITSKDNPNVKFYRKLSENKKFRRENGMFVLEGLRIIDDAVKENAEICKIFAAESCAESFYSNTDLPDAEKYIIPDELGNKLSDTGNTQGVFAVCRIPNAVPPSEIIKSGGKYVLLHQVRDPGNLGTIIRTADAVGADGLFLSDCCDLYNPKVVRSTMGSIFRVNVSEIPFDEIFPVFGKNNIATFAAVIDSGAVSLTDIDFSEGAAVLIGNEGNGLPKEIADMCDVKMTIKMKGNINSLNAAMAAGIIMWEFTKKKDRHGNAG